MQKGQSIEKRLNWLKIVVLQVAQLPTSTVLDLPQTPLLIDLGHRASFREQLRLPCLSNLLLLYSRGPAPFLDKQPGEKAQVGN